MEQSLQELKSKFSAVFNANRGIELDDESLHALIHNFPYCQSLHIYQAVRTKHDQGLFKKHLAKAALFAPQREVLYSLVNPEPPAGEEKTANATDSGNGNEPAAQQRPTEEELEVTSRPVPGPEDSQLAGGEAVIAEGGQPLSGDGVSSGAGGHLPDEADQEQTAGENTMAADEHTGSGDDQTMVAAAQSPVPGVVVETENEPITGATDETVPETDASAAEEVIVVGQDTTGVAEQSPTASHELEPEEELSAGTEEQYEEAAEEAEAIVLEEEVEDKEEAFVITANTLNVEQQEEPAKVSGDQDKAPLEYPIFQNIASSDYFVFNKSTADPLANISPASPVTPVKEPTAEAEAITSAETDEENKQVSKYDDDKMPYTFVWWLHKTRLEHAATYQPYLNLRPVASGPRKEAAGDQLNQQIIESIFHQQVPLPPTPPELPVSQELKHREEDLIDKFIHEEPQIRPPAPDRLDMENKARKSSEDNFDLVSETLASIYIDQMLFHKAIDTYKKLSLKFPEKSGYFAGLIRELQKKIN